MTQGEVDRRDDALGDWLEDAVRTFVADPADRLPRIVRRGAWMRTTRWTAIGTAVAVFVGSVIGTALLLGPPTRTPSATAGSLDSTGWSIRFPSGWHVQRLPPCANAPERTGIIVSNVDYRFANPDGQPPGCEDRLVHPSFPAGGVAVALLPVGLRIGGSLGPEHPTPFPIAWRQLELASPGIDGPRASYLGLVVHGEPVMYLRTWVGDGVSAEALRQARAVVASIRLKGASTWTTYHDEAAGFIIRVPPDWLERAHEPLGGLSFGAVSTFPIRSMTGVCQAPFPLPLVGMRTTDVAIAVGRAPEGSGTLGARPAAFGPETGEVRHERVCQVEGGSLATVSFRFEAAGAPREVEVGFGTTAWMDGQLKRVVWTMLDSLSFDSRTHAGRSPSIDVGIGRRICDVSPMTGDVNGDGRTDTVAIGTTARADGSCPSGSLGRHRILVVDLDGNGRADLRSTSMHCTPWCVPFAVVDLNGDGVAEIFVNEGHLVAPVSAAIGVYELRSGRLVDVRFPNGSNRFPLENSWQGYYGALCADPGTFTTWRGVTDDGGALRRVVYRTYVLDTGTLRFRPATRPKVHRAAELPGRTGWDRLCGAETMPFG